METITVELDEEVYKALEQMAKFENMKIEQLASELVRLHFNLDEELDKK